MEKTEHGRRLAAAMAARNMSRRQVADVVGRGVRTVTGWTSGDHMPDEAQRVILRRVLGDYDAPGDQVEIAVRASELTEDRQFDVLGYYKKRLREQRMEAG